MFRKPSFFFYWLLFIGAFLCMAGRDLFDQSTFMDGLIYSDVSLNLAEGEGSFWLPKYTDTWNPFYEHPPLAFYFQSLFLGIFGHFFWADLSYAICLLVLSIAGIIKLYNLLTDKKEGFFLTLFFLLSISVFWWSICSNLLENTVMVFSIWSSYFIIKNEIKPSFYFLLIAGTLILGAFLSKGLTGLFPFSLPFFIFLFRKEKSFTSLLKDTLFVLMGFLIPFLLIILLNKEAWTFIERYFELQIMGSIQNVQTVDTRFTIVFQYFTQLIPVFIVGIAVYFSTRKKVRFNSWTWILLAYSLSAVLPICISLKQRGFYILAAYPFACMAVALFIQENINLKISLKLIAVLGTSAFLTGITITVLYFNVPGPHKNLILSSDKISTYVSGTIGADQAVYKDWSFQAYLYRRHRISLDRDEPYKHPYLLFSKGHNPPEDQGYSILKELDGYIIYRKN